MWPVLIRGSVPSSIRSSSRLSSDKIPPIDLHSSNLSTDSSSSSINNYDNTSHFATHPDHSSLFESHDYNKSDNAMYEDYNLNNRLGKGVVSSSPHTKDESLPSAQSSEKMNNEMNTSAPTSSVRTLRASRSLLDIAASRPSSRFLNRSSSDLIGSDSDRNTDDDDDDDDDSNSDNNINDDDDDDNERNIMNDMNGKYKDGITDNTSSQWNDKELRQDAIFTFLRRTSKRPTITNTTVTPTSIESEPQEDTTTKSKHMDKPKKKRRWENVSPPSSPTKKNYEMSLATIAEPPHKRKATGANVPRPHACHICGRCFNRRYNLTAHIRVHDPDRKKLFDCPSCSQSFDRKHDRDRHADALHYEHKHRCYCHLCDASFTRRDALTRHVHKLHTQALPTDDQTTMAQTTPTSSGTSFNKS